MLTIPADILHSILAHARAEHPDMACGLVAGPIDSDRPERFVRMRNAEASTSFWSFDPEEQLRTWIEMDRRDEEPVVIYYSQNCAGATLSDTSLRFATEENVHYLVVSTYEQAREEYRSYRVRDGVAVGEKIVVVDGAPGWQRPS
ncbi:Mov34/MPN/PAD-1 family protein [Catenulispora sp. GP43]|uniref:Mov34/MPN/PAD-1 family protein n=1 Tax=Catenulispora sp. GP43 TaxID=3156263 RepID=UPI003518D56C